MFYQKFIFIRREINSIMTLIYHFLFPYLLSNYWSINGIVIAFKMEPISYCKRSIIFEEELTHTIHFLCLRRLLIHNYRLMAQANASFIFQITSPRRNRLKITYY